MSAEAALMDTLRSGAASVARCWRVTRRDGEVLGFTDHDEPLRFAGTVFEAEAGLDANAIERSTGLNVDNSAAVGALRSDRIAEADILAGRYDGAEVEQWLVDWTDPSARMLLFRGSLGEIRETGTAFEAELRGIAETLNRPIGRSFLPSCDRRLGDARCGVDLGDPAYRAEGEVEKVEDAARLRVSLSGAYAAGWFEEGVLTWTTGANAGTDHLVKADPGGPDRLLDLWREPFHAVAQGDRFVVIAGCDKRFGTCRDKFGNSMNFRGFPHMPGDDWVTAYPNGSRKAGQGSVMWRELDADG